MFRSHKKPKSISIYGNLFKIRTGNPNEWKINLAITWKCAMLEEFVFSCFEDFVIATETFVRLDNKR